MGGCIGHYWEALVCEALASDSFTVKAAVHK